MSQTEIPRHVLHGRIPYDVTAYNAGHQAAEDGEPRQVGWAKQDWQDGYDDFTAVSLAERVTDARSDDAHMVALAMALFRQIWDSTDGRRGVIVQKSGGRLALRECRLDQDGQLARELDETPTRGG